MQRETITLKYIIQLRGSANSDQTRAGEKTDKENNTKKMESESDC